MKGRKLDSAWVNREELLRVRRSLQVETKASKLFHCAWRPFKKLPNTQQHVPWVLESPIDVGNYQSRRLLPDNVVLFIFLLPDYPTLELLHRA